MLTLVFNIFNIMKISDNLLQPHFIGNYFCLFNKENLAFVTISKNAITYLKKHAVYSLTGYIPSENNIAHNCIGFNEDSGYLYPIDKINELEQERGRIIKFAVWRDPVERLISFYKLFFLEKEYRPYFAYLNLYNDNSFDRFMEFIRFELRKSNPLFQDEHIRRQCDCYSPEDVDYVVHIRKLDQFLKENGVEVNIPKANETTVKFQLENPQYIKEIKELYAKDYEIITNY